MHKHNLVRKECCLQGVGDAMTSLHNHCGERVAVFERPIADCGHRGRDRHGGKRLSVFFTDCVLIDDSHRGRDCDGAFRVAHQIDLQWSEPGCHV